MKRLFLLALTFCMIFVLAACGSGNAPVNEAPDDVMAEDFKIPLGDTGAKIDIPPEMGFETYESEFNEFYGGGPNGEWKIIVNTDLKSDLTDCTLAEYANLTAQANGAEGAAQDADGNYYFIYRNEADSDKVYKCYTAVREDAEKYYRVTLYCFDDLWDIYSDRFAEWATTVEVE